MNLKIPFRPRFYIALGCSILLVAAFGAEAKKPKTAKSAKPAKEKKENAADKLFASQEVPRIKIEISPEGMAVLEKYQWQFGPQQERESVKATVREGGKTYTNVALHLKGAAGSFRPVSDNPALTLNFDKFVDGQRFHGLSKLSLNNSVQDSTLISEEFCRELFLKAGVATPRATHATVELNGRDLGLYVLVEGFNKQFLKHNFKNPDGNLYDGGFVKDVTQELAVNSGDHPKDQSDRIALAEAAAEPNLTNRLARLEKVLDLNRFLTYVALDVMLWDWDGYAQNKNNWRLFHDLDSGKMVFIPHGLDQMFWKPEGSILPNMEGLVAKSVLQIPEMRARYFERIKELRKTVFITETMTNRVREISAKISPVLKEKNADAAKEQTKAVEDFCSAIVRRGRSIDDQLANPITPLHFDGAASVVLSKWNSRPDFGRPLLDRQSVEGKEVLHLAADNGSSVGTWRSRVWLEPGRYRVEARVKTRGIQSDIGDTRAGAGLRVGKSRSDKYLVATTDWNSMSSEFSIDNPLGEIELLCEFRGAEGEAWFESPRLEKLPPKEDKKDQAKRPDSAH
ncbi:MAG TPA: CotH kinase family protein [Verrucomicrobiae bacterium]|nr:CotH kinase family protein [Verrucomicrobiae bacterium]